MPMNSITSMNTHKKQELFELSKADQEQVKTI